MPAEGRRNDPSRTMRPDDGYRLRTPLAKYVMNRFHRGLQVRSRAEDKLNWVVRKSGMMVVC